jgi:hypothetical protein
LGDRLRTSAALATTSRELNHLDFTVKKSDYRENVFNAQTATGPDVWKLAPGASEVAT